MKIITDCAADMPAEELGALDIIQAPLYINFPDGVISSADISLDAFYDRLEAMRPTIPTTSQPSGGIFAEMYRELAQAGESIFSIHISSGLSGTLHAAEAGREEVAAGADVTVWDTMTLSGGERFQVLAAALAVKAGWLMKDIQERLASIREATEVIYTLDTLEYLAHGGRIGRVQALASSVLNIKPIICVDHKDGKYTTVSKSRTISRALSAIVDHLHGIYTNTPLWVTVLHGRFQDAAQNLTTEINGQLNVAKIENLRISPVLGVHTGPGIVGAAVVPIKLFEDLV